MEFTIEDFEPSDGIYTCESIIKTDGLEIKKGVIWMVTGKKISKIVGAAIDYLCDEWDYCTEIKKD